MNPSLPFQCPLDVCFLMHCHTTPAPFQPWGDAVRECANRMIAYGLIEAESAAYPHPVYRTTPLGDALVEAVLLTRIPRVVYVNEQGVILDRKP